MGLDIDREFKRQLEILKFGAVEITPEDEFEKMLRYSIENDRPLRIKCGIDPTGADVHIGHLVQYRKMRQFQDLGHIGVVVIGDYTARIGDPSGKEESRPQLTKAQTDANARDYMEQVLTVLDESKTEVRYQTEWFEDVTLQDVLTWASQTTVAKLISHETFKTRLEQGNPLGLHEFFYPILQGMDSVFIEADVEIGGTDQKFNILMGRDFQRAREMRPQSSMMLPLMMGTDGKMKMSKSLGNYIGIKDEPFDKFGKVMSIPDDLMINYYQYGTTISEDEFNKIKGIIERGEIHPNQAKKELAKKIVSIYHGEEIGAEMLQQFEAVFAKGQVPDDIDDYNLSVTKEDNTLMKVLVQSGILTSNGEVKRLVKQSAIKFMDGDKITDPAFIFDKTHCGKVIKVGKRKFLRIME